MSNGDRTRGFLSKNSVTLTMNLVTLVITLAVAAATVGIMWANQQNDVSNNTEAILRIEAQSEKDKEEIRAEVKSINKQATKNEVQFAEIQKDLIQIRKDLAANMVVALEIRDRVYGD